MGAIASSSSSSPPRTPSSSSSTAIGAPAPPLTSDLSARGLGGARPLPPPLPLAIASPRRGGGPAEPDDPSYSAAAPALKLHFLWMRCCTAAGMGTSDVSPAASERTGAPPPSALLPPPPSLFVKGGSHPASEKTSTLSKASSQ